MHDYSKVDCVIVHLLPIFIQFDEVETVWTIVNQTLHQVIDLFVPKVRIKTKQY